MALIFAALAGCTQTTPRLRSESRPDTAPDRSGSAASAQPPAVMAGREMPRTTARDTAPASASPTPDDEIPNLEADRAAILALAGSFLLTSHRDEDRMAVGDPPSPDDRNAIGSAIASADDSELDPGPASFSARVRVEPIVVEPDRIVLQHFLLFGQTPLVVKYYREDWQLDPAGILTVEPGGGEVSLGIRRWSKPLRAGTWSRTLYAADDAPAYAAWGRWEHTTAGAVWQAQRPVWGQTPEGHLDPAATGNELVMLQDQFRVPPSSDPSAQAAVWHRLRVASPDDGDRVKMAGEEVTGGGKGGEGGKGGLLVRETRHRYRLDAEPGRSPQAVAGQWEPTAAYWQAVRVWWERRLADGTRVRLLSRSDGQARWKVVLDAVQTAADAGVEVDAFAASLDGLMQPFVVAAP